MAQGFLDEVRLLYARGDLTDSHPAIRAVGYRQIWAHLTGSYPLEAAVARAVAATRQLAKRQLTWFGRDGRVRWLSAGARPADDRALVDEAERVLREALSPPR